jgi:hypothetical protein
LRPRVFNHLFNSLGRSPFLTLGSKLGVEKAAVLVPWISKIIIESTLLTAKLLTQLLLKVKGFPSALKTTIALYPDGTEAQALTTQFVVDINYGQLRNDEIMPQ